MKNLLKFKYIYDILKMSEENLKEGSPLFIGGETMTLRQQRFCDAYLETGNATESAIRAGYSKDSAYSAGQRLLKNVEIKEYLRSRLDAMHSSSVASAEEVMQYLTRGVRQELEEDAVVGSEIVKKRISLRDSNKCAELLAKRFGMLTDGNVTNIILPIFGGEENLEE